MTIRKFKQRLSKTERESKIETLKRNIRLMQDEVNELESTESLVLVEKKQKRTKNKNKEKEFLDFLWSLLIKALANFQSELSGNAEDLQSHHLIGKPNNDLRYSILNGICVTQGEHHFGFHNPNRTMIMNRKVMKLRGKDLFDKLEGLRRHCKPFSRQKMQESLLIQLKPHEEKIKNYFVVKNYRGSKVKKLYEKLFQLLKEIK